MWTALFPPICLGCDRLLLHDRALALCTRCQPLQARLPEALAEARGIRATWDYDGPLARAVLALKFEAALALAGPLGRLLAGDPRLLRSPGGAPWELLVPVPLHWRRRLLRGFDQSEELGRWALRHAAQSGADARPRLAPRLLRRTRATRAQSELIADERATNVSGAFALRRRARARVRGRRVLVLDDVTTTGATLSACMQALAEGGAAEVGGLALLRST
jgi:ComF family protein